jgi:hypothetical protein
MMVGPHSFPLHGLMTNLYRGESAVCLPSGRRGISPLIRASVIKFLCHASPVFPRFRVNGSHLFQSLVNPKYTTPDGGQLVTTEEQHYDPMTQIQHYTRHLTFLHPGGQREEKTLRTALRYVFPQEMEALLFYNGLQIRSCYGNWQQDPLTATSGEMIYVCQRRV